MAAPLSNHRSEAAFEDFKLPLLRDGAMAEATRCLFCHDAPCIKACPTAIDIPQFIRKIASDNVHGAAKTIFESNILGMSCARVCPVEVLCVGACVYNDTEQPPIAIGKLQRYATDRAYDESWKFFSAGPNSGKRVALIGGGPASLAAAHELRRLGHACTILEKRATLGGLNTTGVAPYKMRADRSISEVEWVLSIGGIEVRTNVTVGEQITLAQLERDFDAVFIGVGLGADTMLGIPGETRGHVHGAVEWIERMKLRAVDLSDVRRAVIIGGGNTALDAAREVRGLGVPRVTMVYRGRREVMSGYAHEFAAAANEGVEVEGQAAATALRNAREGTLRVGTVSCTRLDDGRRAIAGSAFELDADLVLVAIGQAKLSALFDGFEGITLDHGRIRTDTDGRTGRARWYAGGDCQNGGVEVVNAAAEGKAAARGIDADFRRGGAR